MGLVLALFCQGTFCPVHAGCDDPYILSHHKATGKLDICGIESELGDFKILTNWGTKPEWLNDTQFVFLSNQIGDVYLMDIERNTVRNLTSHFKHAGFTRAHKLNTGDLLLVGPVTGPQPPKDPLSIYDNGQFSGCLWVFEAPFNKQPYLLKRKVSGDRMVNIPAWEGIAVSKESNRIVWSDTQTPFFSEGIIKTGWNYNFKPSNLWVGEFIHGSGRSYLDNARKIVPKKDIGAVFLEPQNFIGKEDQQVSFSAYGPSSSGSGDTYLYDFKSSRIKQKHLGKGYEEWEGVAPDYQKTFIEIDSEASRFKGPEAVELYIYDFSSGQNTRVTYFRNDHLRADGFYLHEPVFSPNGKFALFATGGGGGWEINSPGYSIGIVMVNIETYMNNPGLEEKRGVECIKPNA